jgi:hypothetical protein
VVSAYADNVVLAGPLSGVEAAHADYCSSMQVVGLTLNPLESHMYIPHWRFTAAACKPCILGCPVGSPEYWTVYLSKIVADIQKDLDELSAFPSLHQRTKLALHCCNTRITYL